MRWKQSSKTFNLSVNFPANPLNTWRVAGCVGAGPRGSAAGGGIAGVMPEVGREGQVCPGTVGRAGG